MLRHVIILLFVLVCHTIAKQHLNLTQTLSAAAVNSNRRDVYFLPGDVTTWRYTACTADSNDKGRIRELSIQSQTSALGPFKTSYDGQSNIKDITVVRNYPDQCAYVSLDDTFGVKVTNFLPTGTNTMTDSTLRAYYSQTSSLWLDNRIITFLVSNIGVFTANKTDPLFVNYTIPTDDLTILQSFEAVPLTDSTSFMMRISGTANNQYFYTVLFDCTTNTCTKHPQLYQYMTSASLATSRDRWAMCMKFTNTGPQSYTGGNYTCVSSRDSQNYVVLRATADYPINAQSGPLQLRSCLLHDSIMMLGVSDPIQNTYTIYALDTDTAFALITNSTKRAGTLLSMACQDTVVLAATSLGYEYYVYDNGTGIVFPPIQPPLTATAPTANQSPSATPLSTAPTPSQETQPPTAPPLDVTGIAVGSSIGGAALIAGAVVTGVLVSRYVKAKKQRKSDEEAPTTPMVPLQKDDPDFDKKMQIPFKELAIKKLIGSGSFGKVYIGKWRGVEVAIKVNNMIQDTKGFLAEAKLTLSMPPHPNLVQTFGVSIDSNHPCIVLEFCDGGSLDNIVFNHKLNVDEQRALVKGIAFGLAHLHSHKIVHRDLAVRNILLDKGLPKISDFGMSRVLSEEAEQGRTNTTVGPVRWMAPESIVDMRYSIKSDVWTFGIVVNEIVTGHEPHEGENQLDVARNIKDNGYTPSIPDNCDPVLKQVMEMCWKYDPAERPNMDQICEFLSQHF